MQAATLNEVIEIASRMAQELQELIGDAQDSGSDLPSTKALVDEWESVFKRTELSWQFAMSTKEDSQQQVSTNDNFSLDLAEPAEPESLIESL